MAEYFTDISVSARFSELPKLLGTLAEHADRLGIPADDGWRLQLLAEELFTNTVTHGYHGENDASVRLSLSRRGDVLRLCYEDNAPAFDPTTTPQKSASDAEIGGLGITLIRGMCRAIRYQRQNDSNRIEIDL